MKSLFHKWLLLFVILAFGLTFGFSWFLHRKEAKENALQLLAVNLNDAAGRVQREEANLQTITEMSAASAIAKTRAFALLIQENPSILKDTDALNLIRQKLDVDELHVSDKTVNLLLRSGIAIITGKIIISVLILHMQNSLKFLCRRSLIRRLSWFKHHNTAELTAGCFNTPGLHDWMSRG